MAMRKKYGYKPKAQSLRGLGAMEMLEMLASPAIRLFSMPFGEHYGETRWARGIPWAGATEGASNTAEAIEMIRAVSPGVASRCEAFAREASHVKGVQWVRYPSGRIGPMPKAAFARHKKGTLVPVAGPVAGKALVTV